jgi:small-conductance mechanosensitive channel
MEHPFSALSGGPPWGAIVADSRAVSADRLLAFMSRAARATATELDDSLIRRIRGPARLLVVVVALHAFAASRGGEHPVLQKGVLIVELLLATYLAIESAETIVLRYWLGERKKVQLPALVRHLILAVLYAVSVLSIVGSVTGIDVLPLLATSTVLTVVLGLALQDTLGNLFTGLALHSERPFGVGDWILVDGIEGEVVYLGWRSTRLLTFSGDIVSLPNSMIAKARIHNFYAPVRRCARNVEHLVAVSASPEAVERAARRALGEVPRVLEDPAPKVRLTAVTPLYQRYMMTFWIHDFAHHDDIESDVMKALFHASVREGVALAPAAPIAAASPDQPGVVAAAAPAAPAGD